MILKNAKVLNENFEFSTFMAKHGVTSFLPASRSESFETLRKV